MRNIQKEIRENLEAIEKKYDVKIKYFTSEGAITPSNDKYDASNFVVFNIKLDGYTINGQSTTLNKDIYWYGFLLNNNQSLQVVNMTTATYYNFTKK